jgi:peptidoglycan DL-endopeptidase CwlO
MGIYIGNDQYVHAPHTGDVVKISTLSTYGGYVGAVRISG